jgi:hypothetical protein
MCEWDRGPATWFGAVEDISGLGVSLNVEESEAVVIDVFPSRSPIIGSATNFQVPAPLSSILKYPSASNLSVVSQVVVKVD